MPDCVSAFIKAGNDITGHHACNRNLQECIGL
jgi:hypothetical protein